METTINKQFSVSEPIDIVWQHFSTPEKIVVCVPGASLTEKINEDKYKGSITLKFGPIKSSYDGLIEFLERDKDKQFMWLKGTGTDVKGKGGATMEMKGKLKSTDQGTDVDVEMKVSVSGMMAQFGSRLIKDASDQVFNQFIGNLKAQLAGEKVDNSLKTGSMMGSMVKGFFSRKK